MTRVGILWRAEWDPVDTSAFVAEQCRLHGMFAAFSGIGVEATPVVYADEVVSDVRGQLLGLDGVLVWVNPIEQGRDRTVLDALLREASAAGVWVSAHPDVIQRLATKLVLVDTAEMSWSARTHLYRSASQLRQELPQRLATWGPLVLKQQRGMGGAGVWKVELDGHNVRVQHAAAGSRPELVAFEEFLRRCESYFSNGGVMVEQPFQPRLAEGMIRVYLSHDRVVGFAHQYPRGLLPPEVAAGLPTEKVFLPASAADYQGLRTQLESRWVLELQQIVGVYRDSLPVIWDIDFLPADGDGAYVLCEINASSTFGFPDFAMPLVARAALDRIAEHCVDHLTEQRSAS